MPGHVVCQAMQYVTSVKSICSCGCVMSQGVAPVLIPPWFSTSAEASGRAEPLRTCCMPRFEVSSGVQIWAILSWVLLPWSQKQVGFFAFVFHFKIYLLGRVVRYTTSLRYHLSPMSLLTTSLLYHCSDKWTWCAKFTIVSFNKIYNLSMHGQMHIKCYTNNLKFQL